ncbi:seryl-tRNA synthetase [Candidatus Planktophila dulcis]|uniref:Serine--tRNA ligase n=1 Tax=Candidatus Planktophila dulcis TaxID=1884914 RepID=A0AAC9YU52_9ACTN|nr:serine--tRNA ligase [Candidatus Planktophila dulcis]ASY12611.1 seryl-tRNA synthetase [Candidatus Planktophila dulcis]
MIDIKFLRENPDVVRASQKGRGENVELVDQIIAIDEIKRAALSEFETLRQEQNVLSKSVGSAKDDEKAALLANAKELADKVKAADTKRSEIEEKAKALLLQLSNLLDTEAPIGGEEDFVTIEHVGTPRDFAKDGFEPKDHVELGKLLGAIDTERGAKVAGSRSYYLTGVGALLEFALVNYAIQSALKNGFSPVIPPVLVNPAAMEGTGFLGQAAENVYRIEKDDVYLVGTSEVPLAAMHMDEILPADKLPLRYAGYSTCFRREAGTYGKDTRGIIRVHQFDKVEMFTFCKPEDAKAEHQRLLQWEKDFLNSMEIPFRVIDVASGDLGSSATRKFDIEAWIPTQGAYREVTSTSNCTEFQARRLNIRYKDAEGTKAIATLNGTLVAIPRMIVAILENHQNADGTVNVPAALQPFLGMKKFELV